MQAGLKELGVDIRKTDFFITLLHSDHLGLVSRLALDTSTIYFNQPDADRIKSGISWDDFADFALFFLGGPIRTMESKGNEWKLFCLGCRFLG